MEWKDEFLRLFTSQNSEEFSAAFELKRQNLPKNFTVIGQCLENFLR